MTASAAVDEMPISGALLDWYDSHARDLPWRSAPGTPAPDPYRVWLSEVMLQQTTVAAVKPYFAAFTRRWPTVEALAAASEEEVMAAWAGLGYYSRARNLYKCAQAVSAMGGFPQTEAELCKLPGLGDYTAAAVAAIAFGKDATPVDANVERVVARLFAIDEPLPKGRKAIRAKAQEVTPPGRAGDFAQALMDLGSGICTSRDPKCLLCPIGEFCEARSSGEPARFPVKAPKKPKPTRTGTAWWIQRDGTVLLVRRPGEGMLGGMRALPDDGWNARGDGDGKPPIDGTPEPLGLVRHVFTHFALELSVVRITASTDPRIDGDWWPLDQLEDAGLPTLFAKAARLALA